MHTNEVFFRDTAHGFLAWAFATVISATALGAATTHIASGAAAGLGGAASQAAQAINPSEIYVDKLFRTDTAAPAATPAGAAVAPTGAPDTARAEVLRLWTAGFRARQDLSAPDRAYVVRLIAARTGMSPADAEKRVTEITTEAKDAADRARKGAAKLSLWLTASLLFGAFAASLAAVEGGQLRDGTWNDRVLVPRPI